MTISPLLPSTFLLKRVYDYVYVNQPFQLLLMPHATSSDSSHAYFAGICGTEAKMVRTNLAENEQPVFDVVSLPANIVTDEEEAKKMIVQAIDDDAWSTEESKP